MRKLFLFICLISFASCMQEKIDLQSNPIDSNINVEFREMLGKDSRQLTLHCQTEKAYPCINYPIAITQNFENNKLSITFTKVLETDFCLTAIGPASVGINVPTLDNGTYEIELNNGNFANTGKFIVSDEKVELLFKNPKGINIVRKTTQRVPRKTYWGTIGYHTETTAGKVNDFLQKASALGADFNKQTPGDYYYYEIDNKGDIVTETENSGYYFVKAFIFQFDGNEELFKKEIKDLAKTYFDDMYISINTYKGEYIYNWD